MPTTTKFCTLDDVKHNLNNATDWTSDDPSLTSFIKQATALIRQYTRRSWEQGTFTQFFTTEDVNIAIRRGGAAVSFILKEKPLTAVTEVKYHTGGDWTNARALSASNYEVDLHANSVVLYPQIMESSQRSLRIVYTAGYSVNSQDADLLNVGENLRQACAIQAAFMFKRVINETQGARQKQDKKGFVNYGLTSSGLVSDALSLIKSDVNLLVGGNG